MKLLAQLLLLLALLLLGAAARAQVGVGTTTPDAKSALDVRATDKGLLIPRLTQAQRLAISAPPQGLMVYQTDGSASGGTQTGFWYYSGTGGWVFIEPAGSGLTLPYGGTASTIGNAFQVGNTGLGSAIVGTASNSTAVSGTNSGSGTGVSGTSAAGTGVRGVSSGGGWGLSASSATGVAVQAQKSAAVPLLSIPGQTGRVAELSNLNADNDSSAVFVTTSGDGPAIRAEHPANSAQPAIRGVTSASTANGAGVEGVLAVAPNSSSNRAAGVRGIGRGLYAAGVLGLSDTGDAVRGMATGSTGNGVKGYSLYGYGVWGESETNVGVVGYSGTAAGVWARSNSGPALLAGKANAETGLVADLRNTATANASAVLGIQQNGAGPAISLTASSGRTAEVHSNTTGTANLLPVAYGRIAANGSIISGSGNFTVSVPFSGTGYFELTFTSANLSGADLTGAVAVASCVQGPARVATARGLAGGQLEVQTWNSANGQQPQLEFSFVLYKP